MDPEKKRKKSSPNQRIARVSNISLALPICTGDSSAATVPSLHHSLTSLQSRSDSSGTKPRIRHSANLRRFASAPILINPDSQHSAGYSKVHPVPFIPTVCPQPNIITTLEIRNSSPSSWLWRSGGNGSRGLRFHFRFGRTIRTSSTSKRLKDSNLTKPNGLCSTFTSLSARDLRTLSREPYLVISKSLLRILPRPPSSDLRSSSTLSRWTLRRWSARHWTVRLLPVPARMRDYTLQPRLIPKFFSGNIPSDSQATLALVAPSHSSRGHSGGRR